MAAATIFSSKGESLPRPRFFSIPFFWGKEDLRINHSSNDLKSSLTVLTKYYPAETETQPGTCVISSLPTLYFLERSLLLSVATSHSLFTCVKPEANPAAPSRGDWHQLTLPNPIPTIWQEDHLWCVSFSCHLKLPQSGTPRFSRCLNSLLISLCFHPLTSKHHPLHPSIHDRAAASLFSTPPGYGWQKEHCFQSSAEVLKASC